jgi:glycosyltransferase involved in cell wall biosynthesis
VLRAVAADARFSEVTVFCSPRADRNFEVSIASKIREIESELAEKSRIYRLWWLENRLPSEVRRCGSDVLLCMGGAGRAGGQVPHVTFVQQTLPFFPEGMARSRLFERVRMRAISRAMKKSCKASRQVIVQTPTMRRRVAEAFCIPEERISVVLPAVGDLPEVTAPSGQLAAVRAAEAGRRLLYVGSASAYKNVDVVVSAMKRLRDLLPGLSLFLTWPPDHPVCRTGGVVGLGYLQGTALREAYELATVLIMPSLVETVGLPMLEAMNLGTPVLAADRPYAHDVGEDGAMFFDPLDASDLARKIMDILRDECLRGDLRTRGHDLIRRRRAERPYERVLDVVAGVASICSQTEVLP